MIPDLLPRSVMDFLKRYKGGFSLILGGWAALSKEGLRGRRHCQRLEGEDQHLKLEPFGTDPAAPHRSYLSVSQPRQG